MGIYVLSILATQQLDTCGTEQSATNKYGDVFLLSISLALTAGNHRHYHAEQRGPCPKTMLLHTVHLQTWCVFLFAIIISQFSLLVAQL